MLVFDTLGNVADVNHPRRGRRREPAIRKVVPVLYMSGEPDLTGSV